ncbi:hypothetical protein BDZ97DRAFT_107479 [Flammula alnicola]|nr:hypothetical protein BDZ97DRAFT_107479 [Flammula alnicola]
MKDIKYLDIYADDTKNVLLDGDEILNFTGSLGGKKTRPLYLLYDIQTAENPSDGEGEGNKDESGDDTNSDEDESDWPTPNYTLRLQATRSNARIREYMSMNVGDYSYTDGVLHAMPNAMPGLEYYLAEKRNRRGKVIDSGCMCLPTSSRRGPLILLSSDTGVDNSRWCPRLNARYQLMTP